MSIRFSTRDNVTLVTNANVQRLETDPSGRTVTGVVTQLGDGSSTTFTGDIVVVACGAVNSAALLLRSAGDTHPDGLANSSGVVGRHYMRHNNLALMAVSHEPNPTVFQKTLAMNDWYLGADDWDYPLGGIQMLGKSDEAHDPRRGAAVGRAALTRLAVRGAGASRGGLLAVRRGPAAAGQPGHHRQGRAGSTSPSTRRTTSRASSGCGTSWTACSSELGLRRHHLLDHSLYLHKTMPIGATAHQAGTVRFGTDPASQRAGRQLQGARPGQPVRRRHQLLPEHRGGEPVADRDRQCAAGG